MILISVTLLIIGFGFLFFSYIKRYLFFKQRLEKLSLVYQNQKSPLFEQDSAQQAKWLPYVLFLVDKLKLSTADKTKILSKRLMNAGWLSKQAVAVFLVAQTSLFVLALFLVTMAMFFLPMLNNLSWLIKASILLVVAWIAYKFPEWYLKRRIKSYQVKLKVSIVDFLDLFMICIEAGYSNDRALQRISLDLEKLHPELSEQIKILNTELTILPSRRQAWENFAERTGIDEVAVVTQIIMQSERLGASLGQALRAQIEVFRGSRLSLIETRAMRLPAFLTLPLVLFIFPALLLVILGPAVLKAMSVLGGGA